MTALTDCQESRRRLISLARGFEIETVACPSGQRLVYFGTFVGPDCLEASTDWGSVVAKMSAGIGPTEIARLQREVRILNDLASPYYPKMLWSEVFSVDPETDQAFPEGRIYITIEERIVGQPLSQVVNDYSSETRVVSLLTDLAIALDVLWSRRPPIIHRDIKPDNILIRPNGEVVIIDLGISREAGNPGETHTAMPFGPCTPAFSSPEQAQNHKASISFKSDFFALGTLAYTLLTGRNPYADGRDDDIVGVLDAVIRHEPPTLCSLGLASQELSDLVERLQRKDPYRRPRTPKLLIAELTAMQRRQHGN